MAKKPTRSVIQQATQRIDGVRGALAQFDLVCSGTLTTRTITCGKPTCRCHDDPSARHGPYHQWGHMQDGKLVHRYVSAQQAIVLRQAIKNYRAVKKLLRRWESATERLIDAQYPR